MVVSGSRRRRRLPGAAPAPPRGAGGRMGFSLLLTKQRSSRRSRRARVLCNSSAPMEVSILKKQRNINLCDESPRGD